MNGEIPQSGLGGDFVKRKSLMDIGWIDGLMDR